MNKISKKVVILSCISLLCLNVPAYAISKLDFVSPASGIAIKVNKVKEKIEEKYNNAMEILNEKVKKAAGIEGAALFRSVSDRVFKSVMNGSFNNLAAGNFNPSDIFRDSFGEFGNMKLDAATLSALANDYAASLEKAKLDRDVAINQMLTELEAYYEVAQTEEEREEYAQQIAQLKSEKQANLEMQTQDDAKVKQNETQLRELQKQLADMEKMFSADELSKILEDKIGDLFTADHEEVENEDLYKSEIEKLFLGEEDYPGGEPLARIKRARNQEYYDALQDLYRVTVSSDVKTDEISSASTTMVDASTQQADGIYGAMSMRIGADVQAAKTAARFTELLLAELRFTTSHDIMNMSDFRLYDYAKDITKFNMDDYALKDKDLKLNERSGTKKGLKGSLSKLTGGLF